MAAFEVHCEYRIRGYTTTNAGERPAWFALDLRMSGKNFTISAEESRFRNSPNRLHEFQEYLSFLMSGAHEDEYEGDNFTEAPHAHVQHAITLDDCFAWAMQPFLSSFKELAPKPLPASKTTLDDFFNSESYECRLGAVDDRLDPGPIDVVQTEPAFIPENLSPDSKPVYGTPASTFFPIFPLSEIEVVSDRPSTILDDEPTVVRVQGQEYFFKSLEVVGEDLGRNEIRKYEQIAKANFGPEVRTSRLFGIAQDHQKGIKGIMLHPIEEESTLDFAVEEETSKETRQRWIQQLQQTLRALHGKDIVWGDAKDANVLIDKEGDAWIVDFGGGYTRGWVGEDSAGTIAGDLEGLEKIIHFINTGEFE